MSAVKRNSPEWNRMWSALAVHFGASSQQNGFEDWQYMGTAGGQHEFRHRSHPVHGRIVWSTPAGGAS